MGRCYIETHEEMVARLTAENAAQEAEKAAIKDEIAAIKNEIATTEDKIAATEDKIAATEAEIADIEAEMAAIEKAALDEVIAGLDNLSDQQRECVFYALAQFGDAAFRAVYTHAVRQMVESKSGRTPDRSAEPSPQPS